MIDHEKLDVYQCSLDFIDISLRIIDSIPRGHSEIKSQLQRASVSITMNIAEGNGRTPGASRRNFFRIARGSSSECSAVVDVCHRFGFISDSLATEAKQLLTRIYSMLTVLLR